METDEIAKATQAQAHNELLELLEQVLNRHLVIRGQHSVLTFRSKLHKRPWHVSQRRWSSFRAHMAVCGLDSHMPVLELLSLERITVDQLDEFLRHTKAYLPDHIVLRIRTACAKYLAGEREYPNEVAPDVPTCVIARPRAGEPPTLPQPFTCMGTTNAATSPVVGPIRLEFKQMPGPAGNR